MASRASQSRSVSVLVCIALLSSCSTCSSPSRSQAPTPVAAPSAEGSARPEVASAPEAGVVGGDGRSLRGRIVEVSGDQFRYDYYDLNEPDPSLEQLRSMGFHGGGPSWAGIVFGLVRLEQPGLMGRLRFDDEGDGLAIWSDDRKALEAVAALVARAKSDRRLLERAIAEAVAEGQME